MDIVAKTISGGIINEQQVAIGAEFIFAGLVGAILWNLMTWLVGLPSSSSHALFGGLVGSVIVGAGVEGVNFGAVVAKVLVPALISPIVAGLAAFVAVKLIYFIVRKLDEKYVETGFRHGQTITACLVALSHGTNDAQKTMGIITLTLIAVGLQPSGSGPQLWVVAVCGLAIALGAYMGGALSTTQVCSGSIIGSGLGKKGGAIDWKVAARMLIAWLVTFPAAGVIGAAACAVAKINVWGTLAVAAIAVVAALIIFRLSRRNPVNAMNVNEGSEVKVNAKVATAAAAA